MNEVVVSRLELELEQLKLSFASLRSLNIEHGGTLSGSIESSGYRL